MPKVVQNARRAQAGPPVKKARVEDLKAASTRPNPGPGRDGAKPKFSMRVGGTAERGNGRVKGKGNGNGIVKDEKDIKGKGKGKQKEEEEEDEDKGEDDDADSGDDGEEDEEEATPSKSKTTLPSQSSSKPTTKTKPKTVRLPTSFKIVAGSYEKLLYGLEGSISASHSSSSDPSAEEEAETATETAPSPYTITLKPIFIFPAHVSCIKAVAASPDGGKWLATGSADEIIKVWDLRRRKEIGGLMHHEGSVTHLHFPSRSHLLSASEDGTLCLFRARDWSVLRALRGHKGRVNAVAVHPSGKVALSVGRDKTLRMWDLMRGKGCASTKLGKEGEIVRWSTDGSLFAVQAGSTIDVYTTNMDLVHTIQHPSRLHDVHFCKRVEGDGELLLAAAEDKHLSVYDISPDPSKKPTIVALMTGHANRVKAVQTLAIALPPLPSAPSTSQRTSTTIACTVSSDGKIRVYDLAMVPPPTPSGAEKVEILPVAVYDSKGTRLTCVTLADGDMESVGDMQVGEKRKHEEGGDSEGEEDEDEEEWPEEAEDEDEEEEQEEAEMESE
ncbi:putative WD domain, G-beta repeat [Lyophyllum shimeji]|uniref:WD domain, G-beta repeat n=1 Tax=Lyophyllum shimeji TaxID=47721 RepID=A0A9P3URR2_LYOSH|nr:putative WD domain, G-beta repeat [Lyophyllum shimeji]